MSPPNGIKTLTLATKSLSGSPKLILGYSIQNISLNINIGLQIKENFLMPTTEQCLAYTQQSVWLTNTAAQPIQIVFLDERTGNLFVLAGNNGDINFQINPEGKIFFNLEEDPS
jgi:hypothetical protein